MSGCEEVRAGCPCCGEQIDLFIDPGFEQQEYIEDCPVCCRPITVSVAIASSGDIEVCVRDENSC
jgi:hypothetical protein